MIRSRIRARAETLRAQLMLAWLAACCAWIVVLDKRADRE
jgi:hypothetical protein